MIALLLALAAAPAPAFRAPSAQDRPAHQDDATPPVDAPAPPPDPRPALAVAAPAPRDALGLALWDAREGRADAAIARVEGLRAGAEGELAARLERAARRLAAWRNLRDAYLAALAADGGRLVLMDGDERVRVTVERLTDGVLHLGSNKAGWETYPVDAIPAGDLAQAMGRDADAFAPAWVRLYGYVLAENDKWERLLKDEDAESVALRADAEADLPRLLTAGRCLAELGALSAVDDPVGLAEADALLARIQALRAAGAELPYVAERAGALRGLEGIAHGARFDALGLEAALHGRVTRLEDGRIRLEYGFDDEAELADFVPDDAYLEEHRARLPKVPEGSREEVWIQDGSLRCQGRAVRRLVLPFAAPLSVEYDLSVDPPRSGELSAFHVFVGICDDREARFAWCSNLGDLEVWDGPREVRQALAEHDRGIELGLTYSMKLELSGKRLRALRDKQEAASIECERTAGSVFLWLQSGMRVNVRRIAIEGRVEEAGLADLRAAWVAARVR